MDAGAPRLAAFVLAEERLRRQFPEVRFTGLIVVFHGWELVFCDAVTGW